MEGNRFLRHPLADLKDPWLIRSLTAWRALTGGGRLDAGEVSRVLDDKRLILPASTLFAVDGDDPDQWIVVWQGSQSVNGLGGNLVGCKWGDFGDRRYREAGAEALSAVARACQPVYAEVMASIDGVRFHYDRIAYPLLQDDRVDLVLTVASWRSPAYMRLDRGARPKAA